MITTPIPSENELEKLKHTFCRQSNMNELIEQLNTQDVSNSVSPAKLYNYANGLISYPNESIEKLLQAKKEIRSVYRHMIKNCVAYYSGEALAASEGGLIPRKGKGFSIRFESSRTEQSHLYMVIEIEEQKELNRNNLFVFDEDNTCHQFALPLAKRGIIQMLIPEDGPLSQLMKDSKTEVMIG